MAGFNTKTFLKHDDYMTPKYAWENIKEYLPSGHCIWEPFYGDGKSGEYLKGSFPVIHQPVDFFDKEATAPHRDRCDLIVSNPPFSQIPAILCELVEIGKPFVLIMPSSKINTQYFRRLFAKDEDPIQIIIPRKRIHFDKKVDGETPANYKSVCNFDCFYYCWKMNLPRDIIWLE